MRLLTDTHQAAERVETQGVDAIDVTSGVKGLKTLGLRTVTAGENDFAMVSP